MVFVMGWEGGGGGKVLEEWQFSIDISGGLFNNKYMTLFH